MFIDDLIEKLAEVRSQKGNIRVVKELLDTTAFFTADHVEVQEMDRVDSCRLIEATTFYSVLDRVTGAVARETVVRIE